MRARILAAMVVVLTLVSVNVVWSDTITVSLWEDNFDGPTGGAGWTTYKIDSDYPVDWQMGAPVYDGLGVPSGAYSSPNVYATNLYGSYAEWYGASYLTKVLELYTPVLDLTTVEDNAALSFMDFMQVESGQQGLENDDYCALEVLDSDKNHLGWLAETIKRYDTNGAYTSNTYDLTPYLGQEIIVGYALYVSNYGNLNGWYIDDVKMTTEQEVVLPEPMTLALLGTGAAVLLRRRRK